MHLTRDQKEIKRPLCYRRAFMGLKHHGFGCDVSKTQPGTLYKLARALAAFVGSPFTNKRKLVTGCQHDRVINVGIVQRTQTRKLLGLEKLYELAPSSFNVQTRSMEKLALVEQFRFSAGLDILIGATGAGLAWMISMVPGSSVIVLMSCDTPFEITCSGIWDRDKAQAYGGLAALAGHHHICQIMSDPDIPCSPQIENHLLSLDVNVNPRQVIAHMLQSADFIDETWNKTCMNLHPEPFL
eukprot:TRINITY_DN24901_c0_g1_i2.p1 TRINITY_DN24901_c0_g1~~TRINITY_DN24901_c0_g1_i2.p1  ORF type:complete len:241 (+),score=19.06 TRINITY_DN24901_c0_g1_i2:175-897(+)